ncbi:MAG TPA: hypothetical protein VGQ58_10475 [Candidatus Limnocylindrales bacterium]|jgi:hypothetical protein|nr:hypothetical protein [Candidatus Limnocylindrales bacterium]
MMRGARRLAAVLVAAFAALTLPATVAGHTLEGRYQSQLPLVVYLAGAGMAVALSFAFVLLRDLRAELPAADGPRRMPPAPLRIGLRAIGLLGWIWIVAQGIVGGSSDADVASLFVWVYTWVGIAIVSAFVFPIWQWLDPFSTIHDLGARVLRAAGVQSWEVADYPARLGRWPAVAGMAFVIWLEIVLRGGIGRTLFVVVVAYTAFTLAMMAQFGRDTWRANGETFGVWFRLLNRLAPFQLADESGRVRRRPFASGLLQGGCTRADIVLVAFATGSILFDGLSQTTPWYEVLGAPAPPILTLQLAAFLGLVAAAALGVSALVGVASTAAGLLPIALGYLVAHYLTYLLIDGQRIVIAISDPLQTGADLFGTAFYQPDGSLLSPGLVWTIQLVAVVGGHMIGAWGGHVAATREAGPNLRLRHTARLRQVPLAVVMVALTTITLWSLGQAIFVPPESAVATDAAYTAG